MKSLVGEQLGPYRVLERIALGGMAAVYLARQPSTGREVAIKVLPNQLADDPAAVARFEREAQLLAGLQHPHILPLFDFGRGDGVSWFVTPVLRHGDLADHLARWGEALPLADVRRILLQLCDALDYAHQHGVVHRDLKPANVLLDARGNCLLSDFGIAKLDGGQGLTRIGTVIGTPEYMSPEQGAGREVDARSDVYALGVILYELATGRLPFRAESPTALILKHQSDPPPAPRATHPHLPEALERVILKALAKRPEDRYPSAAAFGDALRAALPDAMLAATAPPPAGQPTRELAPAPNRGLAPAPSRRGLAAVLTVLALATVVTALTWREAAVPTPADGASPAQRAEPRSVPATDSTAPATTAPVAVPSPAPVDTQGAAASPAAAVAVHAGVWEDEFADAQHAGGLDPGRWSHLEAGPSDTAEQRDGVLLIESRTPAAGVATVLPPTLAGTALQRVSATLRLTAGGGPAYPSIRLNLFAAGSTREWLSAYLVADPAVPGSVRAVAWHTGEATPAPPWPDAGSLGEWRELGLTLDHAAGHVAVSLDGVEFARRPLPANPDGPWALSLTGYSGDGTAVRGEVDAVRAR